MNGIKHEFRLNQRAAEAARLNLPIKEAMEDYVIREIGPKPADSKMPDPPDTSAFKQAIAKVEEDLTQHPISPHSLYAALVFLFLAEVISCSFLMQSSMGLENPTRTVWGIAFAAVIFVAMYVLWHLGIKRATATGTPQTQRSFYLAFAVLTIIVLAVTVLRTEDVPDSEESSRMRSLSAAIILTCTTIGPAWLAEIIMQLLKPMIPLIRTRALNQRRITDARRDYDRECAPMKDPLARAQQWQIDFDRIKATFRDRYRAAHQVFHETNGAQSVNAGNSASATTTSASTASSTNGDAS